MQSVKGQSLSVWIWIVGGIITASLLLLIAQSSLMQLGEQTSRQHVIQDFKGLNSEIRNVCRMAPGSRKTIEIGLSGVEAVFSAENRSKAPEEAPILIKNGAESSGRHVCMSFEGSHYGCIQHTCPVNMTYMGVPQKGSEKYILGKESGFKYRVTIEKTSEGFVEVDGTISP